MGSELQRQKKLYAELQTAIPTAERRVDVLRRSLLIAARFLRFPHP